MQTISQYITFYRSVNEQLGMIAIITWQGLLTETIIISI